MFVFETRYAPLYLQAFPAKFRFEEADAHFDEMEAYFASQPAHSLAGLIADARSVLFVDAKTRRRVADAFVRMSPLMATRAVAHAIVLSNTVVRNALTAIFWLKRPPWPIETFATIEEADAWVRSRFEHKGLPTPLVPSNWWHEAVEAKHAVRRVASR